MTNSTPQTEKALKRRKILIWILIAVVILGILVTAGYFGKSQFLIILYVTNVLSEDTNKFAILNKDFPLHFSRTNVSM